MSNLLDTAKPTIASLDVHAGWTDAVPLISAGTGFRDAVASIRELTQLRAGWDGHGSGPITREAIDVAFKVASALDDLSARVVPGSGGGLQFELRHGARALELEVLPDGRLEALLLLNGEADNERQLSLSEVPQVFSWIRRH